MICGYLLSQTKLARRSGEVNRMEFWTILVVCVAVNVLVNLGMEILRRAIKENK